MSHNGCVSRRSFLQSASALSLALLAPGAICAGMTRGRRIGIIGLDSSHGVEFTRILQGGGSRTGFDGYSVTHAYPYGSRTIAGAAGKIAANIPLLRSMGVTITDSLDDLLRSTDVILLETNDGRLHYRQALEVFRAGKPVFIDKPLAASLEDVLAIYLAAFNYNVPVFSASSLRYMENLDAICAGRYGAVLGADIYGPAPVEASHPDLFWYGVHGMEALCRVMGPGCRSVTRIYTSTTDVVTGIWPGERVGVFRGTRSGVYEFGGTVFCEKRNVPPGAYPGYGPLLEAIIRFFDSGEPPVDAGSTLELYALMAAADESKRRNGRTVEPSTSKILRSYHEQTNR